MRVFTCRDHDGKYLGGCSVVAAPTVEMAYSILDKALIERGLKPHDESPYTLQDFVPDVIGVKVLFDGDY